MKQLIFAPQKPALEMLLQQIEQVSLYLSANFYTPILASSTFLIQILEMLIESSFIKYWQDPETNE